MPRESSKSISVDPNVRCLRIYPIEKTSKNVRELKTVGIKLSRDLARSGDNFYDPSVALFPLRQCLALPVSKGCILPP
jgi:hypothetical protein